MWQSIPPFFLVSNPRLHKSSFGGDVWSPRGWLGVWRFELNYMHLLPKDVAQTLACSIVMSRMDYCNSLFCGSIAGITSSSVFYEFRTTSLVSSCSRHLGRMLRRCSRHSTAWLPVSRRISYKIAMLTFKAHKTSIPSVNFWFLQILPDIHCVRRRDPCCLFHEQLRTVTTSRGFSSAAPSIWNKLRRFSYSM